MEALGIVDGVDEDANGTSRVLDVLEAAAVDFFGLEGLHEMRRCGSGAFDVRYTLNSGAKSNVAGCPSWV